MANDFTTGTLWQSSIPAWQRTYYEGLLMETLRTKKELTGDVAEGLRAACEAFKKEFK